MIRFFSILFMYFSFTSVMAQTMTVAGFDPLPYDSTALIHPRNDYNGQPCALIKVQLERSGATFHGNVMGDIGYDDGIYLVYMSSGSKMLQIRLDEYLPAFVNFTDWHVPGVEEYHTYQLTLKLPPVKGVSSNTSMSQERHTFTVNGVSFDMIRVEGGTLTMEACNLEAREEDEKRSTHLVTLSTYYIGETEVTQELWEAVMGYNPSFFLGTQRPVEEVDWIDCQKFIKKLNILTGKTFRLPTEAEWEYAALGGQKSRGYKYSGSNTIDNVSWYSGNTYDKGESSPDYGTHDVKTKQPNELGIYDMSGNVEELCRDFEWLSFFSMTQRNPMDSERWLYHRVCRGGGWRTYERGCRLSVRNINIGESNRLGLRLVLFEEQPDSDNGNMSGQKSESDTTATTRFSSSNSTQTNTFTVGGVSFTMVSVEGGTFMMGATSEQGSEAGEDEKPAHSVTLSPYSIGETEVTQELWEAVMGSNPSYFYDPKRPVECVNWLDCQEFIWKLNAKTGKTFRMPTEAEWEYAARGGKMSKDFKYVGSNNIDSVAWYVGNAEKEGTSPDYGTHRVALKHANELGLYDMSGNVEEWCGDWFDEYVSSEQINPIGSYSGAPIRISRGGNWLSRAESCRSTARFGDRSNLCSPFVGLRLVLSVEQADFYNVSNRITNIGSNLSETSSFISPKISQSNENFTVNGITFSMVKVEGGTFTMGATKEQGIETSGIEKTAHQVTLSSYWIGETEVTQELWEAVMGSNPSRFKGSERPVEQVSWDDCQEFIRKLNSATGKTFRLPTEAEWEYAARGGSESKGYKYSGSNDINAVAWYIENSYDKDNSSPDYGTHDVATKLSNELGLFDMSGNVYEWCSDWYGKDYYANSPQTNPKGPESGQTRVFRGGSWYNIERNCRSSHRIYSTPSNRLNDLGLRLALSERESIMDNK